jgi:hypothetical protein
MPEVRCEQTDGVTVGRGDSFAHCGSFSCRARIHVFVLRMRSQSLARPRLVHAAIFGVVAAGRFEGRNGAMVVEREKAVGTSPLTGQVQVAHTY